MRDPGPPSWVEEMRVRRALWFIQLVGDVRQLALGNALSWSQEDIQRLSSIEPEDLTMIEGFPLDQGALEEVRTVTEYLRDLRKGDVKEGPFYKLPRPPTYIGSEVWTTQHPEECLMTWGGVSFMYDYGNGRILIDPTPEIRERYQNPEPSDGHIWQQTRGDLAREAPGLFFFVRQLSRPNDNSTFKFDSFRRLGFGIWDQKRLHFLGLSNGVHEPYQRPEFYKFAWKSLLFTEEITSSKLDP